ncbi:DUF4209 domain-containing protein [Vibrio splendidus]
MKQVRLSTEDLAKFNWQHIDDSVILSYSHHSLESYAQTCNDPTHQYLYRLFAKICQLKGDYSNKQTPLSCHNDKGAMLATLTPIDLDNLGLVSCYLSTPILLGRISEIIWIKSRPRKPVDAQTAIRHYLDVSITPENFYLCTRYCLARACILLRNFKNQEQILELQSKIKMLLEQFEHDLGFYRSLLEFNHKLGIIESDIKTLDLCEQLFKKCLENDKFDLARQYAELGLDLCKTLGEHKRKSIILELKGDAWALEAEQRSEGSALVANRFWTNAINTYRKIQGFKSNASLLEKIRKIEHIKQTQGTRILDSMYTTSSPYDATKTVEDIIGMMQGIENSESAIVELCSFPNPIDKNDVIKEIEDFHSTSFISTFFSGVHVSSDGRTVGHSPAVNTLDQLTDENIFSLSCTSQIVNDLILFFAKAMIIPAIEVINKEHHINEQLMLQLCSEASLIDFDRKYIVSKALLAGFNRDFDIAAHILVPQFEHIVRSSLKENDHLVHSTQNNGTENVSVLSYLLSEPSAKETFDDNFLFELTVLFGNDSILNVRNKLAHGLLNDDESQSCISVYIWWRFMKLAIASTSYVND